MNTRVVLENPEKYFQTLEPNEVKRKIILNILKNIIEGKPGIYRIEGPGNSGKTTLVNLLLQTLPSLISYPGETYLGHLARKPKMICMRINADTSDFLEKFSSAYYFYADCPRNTRSTGIYRFSSQNTVILLDIDRNDYGLQDDISSVLTLSQTFERPYLRININHENFKSFVLESTKNTEKNDA